MQQDKVAQKWSLYARISGARIRARMAIGEKHPGVFLALQRVGGVGFLFVFVCLCFVCSFCVHAGNTYRVFHLSKLLVSVSLSRRFLLFGFLLLLVCVCVGGGGGGGGERCVYARAAKHENCCCFYYVTPAMCVYSLK